MLRFEQSGAPRAGCGERARRAVGGSAPLLLFLLLGAGGGCAAPLGHPDHCARVLDAAPGECLTSFFCGSEPCDEGACVAGGGVAPPAVDAAAEAGRSVAPLAVAGRGHRPPKAPGPPPERHRVEVPPRFLPVPIEPIVARTSCDAPYHAIGDVEAEFGPRLNFSARR